MITTFTLRGISDRFGASEAVAYAIIKLACHVPQDERWIDLFNGLAILDIADDVPTASAMAVG